MGYYEFWRSTASLEWYWHYRAGNGEIIARSTDGYVNKESCLHSIALMKQSGGAPVYPI